MIYPRVRLGVAGWSRWRSAGIGHGSAALSSGCLQLKAGFTMPKTAWTLTLHRVGVNHNDVRNGQVLY